MKKIIGCCLWIALSSCLFVNTSQGATVEKKPQAILIGVLASSGGAIHIAATGLASIITQYTGIKATAEPGDALQRRAPLVRQGEYALLIGNTYDSYVGCFGKKPFKERVPVRLVMTGQLGYIVVATTPGSGIKTVPEIRGKRVAFDYTDAPFLNAAREAIFEAYGVTSKDYRALKGATMAESNQTLIERRSDAIVNSFSAPIMDVDRTVGLYVIPLGQKELNYVHEKVGAFFPATIKAGTYGYKIATPTIGYNTSLYCPTSLSDDLVHLLLNAIIGHYDELAKIHPLLAEWTLENAVKNSAIPFHAGAIEYYKEKGVWTDDLDKKQKEILRALGETQ